MSFLVFISSVSVLFCFIRVKTYIFYTYCYKVKINNCMGDIILSVKAVIKTNDFEHYRITIKEDYNE